MHIKYRLPKDYMKSNPPVWVFILHLFPLCVILFIRRQQFNSVDTF